MRPLMLVGPTIDQFMVRYGDDCTIALCASHAFRCAA
jgi:hypothetical protein